MEAALARARGEQSAALAQWVAKEKPGASVFFLGPDYEMGRSTVAAFKAASRLSSAKVRAFRSDRVSPLLMSCSLFFIVAI